MEPAGRQLAEHRLLEGQDVFYFPNFITVSKHLRYYIMLQTYLSAFQTDEEEYLIRKV